MISTPSAVSANAISLPRFSHSGSEAALHVCVGLFLVTLSVSAFAVSTVFGVISTFVVTLALATFLPMSVPIVIVCAMMFQNMVVAWFTPYIPNNEAFDALRGTNFVILFTAYLAFFAASFQHRLRAIKQLRPWLLTGMVLAAIILFYLALGIVSGNPRDAIVYFRNTITPLACFHIAIVAASLYQIDLRKSLLTLGTLAVAYGYLELVFTMDFLSTFNGDLYIERNIRRQIETGVWEETLRETGFVLRGLQDVMTTTFFNTPLFADILPTVFRIGGPNFHSISYAYVLGIISLWLLFQGRWLLPLAALPLLLIIGSKGAMFLAVIGLCVRVFQRGLGTRLTIAFVVVAACVWVAGAIIYGLTHGDYHVLGLVAGLREFIANPFGQGLGIGGNLSTTSLNVNWDRAQATGATSVPVESAVGVMLYQMGIGSLVLFGFLTALAISASRILIDDKKPEFFFALVSIVTISANAVLQEEAFYAPLALGLCLLLVGVSFGKYWRASLASNRS